MTVSVKIIDDLNYEILKKRKIGYNKFIDFLSNYWKLCWLSNSRKSRKIKFIVDVPIIFSLKENPNESLKCLEILFSYRQFIGKKELFLNFSKCKKIDDFLKENLTDFIAIVISVYNIIFTLLQEKRIKKLEVDNFWFRNYVRKFIEDIKFETDNLISLNNQKDYIIFLLGLKKSFSEIRELLWEISFFDEIFYKTLFNFFNEYEQDFSNREQIPNKEDIMKFYQILMKSILNYERNNYQNFTILYSPI